VAVCQRRGCTEWVDLWAVRWAVSRAEHSAASKAWWMVVAMVVCRDGLMAVRWVVTWVECLDERLVVWSARMWAGQWGDQTAAMMVSRKAALSVQLMAVRWAGLKGCTKAGHLAATKELRWAADSADWWAAPVVWWELTRDSWDAMTAG
jgi:hypothetical protein